MKVLVFSHTIMGNDGFCTNVGGQHKKTGEIIQWRLRSGYNRPLKYSQFSTDMTIMRPGDVLEIGTLHGINPIYQRATHPEDRLIVPSAVSIHSQGERLHKLKEYAEEMAFDSVDELFPGLVDGKYRPAGQPNVRSVGYVWAREVYFRQDDWGNVKIFFTDRSGRDYCFVKVVGIDLKEEALQTSLSHDQEILVRLALADKYSRTEWATDPYPSRCYLMCSHIII